LGELEREAEKKKDELKLIYKDIKAVEVVKEKLEMEMRRKEFSIEMQRANFLHLIKKFLTSGEKFKEVGKTENVNF